jgi:two-component system, chemotaxis family, response regulator Rcp1
MAGKTKILLVEDSPGDARLTIMALKQADFDCIVDHVIDGVEALEHLHAAAEGSPENRIDLVLLDINMPRMNGHETLSRIKRSQILKNTTVVMLTTSESSEEIAFCYEHGGSAFLSKLHDFDAFVETIRGLKNFWIGIVHGDRRVLAR